MTEFKFIVLAKEFNLYNMTAMRTEARSRLAQHPWQLPKYDIKLYF